MILTPGGPLQQLSNASFFLAALFGDILFIRFFLAMAYVFLLTTGALGFPSWPSASSTGNVAVDIIVWASLSGSLHLLAFLRLLADERGISFKSEDEEQLWRFFHRRSGMGRLEFKQVIKAGNWHWYQEGDVILDPLTSCTKVCLLVEGLAQFKVMGIGQDQEGSDLEMPSLLFSGCFFDMRILNVFGLYIGFEGSGIDKWFSVRAKTKCLVYSWSLEELNALATKSSPAVSHYWRNLIATQVGLALTWREAPYTLPVDGTGQKENPELLAGARSRDFTGPLKRYERTAWTPQSFFRWMLRSLTPFMPPGSRHNDLPVHGIMARNRIVALKDAKRREILWQGQSQDNSGHSREIMGTLSEIRRLESIQV